MPGDIPGSTGTGLYDIVYDIVHTYMCLHIYNGMHHMFLYVRRHIHMHRWMFAPLSGMSGLSVDIHIQAEFRMYLNALTSTTSEL